jgi:hypothetical protein
MLVVIGGGCFGTYFARQLDKAVGAGQLSGPVLVVDRNPQCRVRRELGGASTARSVEVVGADWLSFLRRWLPASHPDDHLIPAPLAPHLLWQWLAGELGAEPAPPPRGWNLPYEAEGRDGALYLSAAAWRCPATCIEPAHCPELHAPRDWDLADLLEAGAAARGYRPAVLRCLHLAAGVASIPAASIVSARDRLAAGPPSPVLVATSSRCHAATGALRLPASGARTDG